MHTLRISRSAVAGSSGADILRLLSGGSRGSAAAPAGRRRGAAPGARPRSRSPRLGGVVAVMLSFEDLACSEGEESELVQDLEEDVEEESQEAWEGDGGDDRRPAEGFAVAALPTRFLTKRDVSNAPEEHKVCAVCMEGYKAGDEQKTLPCFHRFHTRCVDEWLRRSGGCPICKHRVSSSELGLSSGSAASASSAAQSSQGLV
mmetsp:Transcript_3233/g.12337  ORF Transcript_3233/g.12337 Transcript_3233/m.12337 type:complete len:203 (-) Transcript_3233:13-621(-)